MPSLPPKIVCMKDQIVVKKFYIEWKTRLAQALAPVKVLN